MSTTLSRYQQRQVLELRAKNIPIRQVAELLGVNRGAVYRFDLKSRQEQQLLSVPITIEEDVWQKLKGLDFLEFNKALRLPSKPGRPDMPIFDYELKVLNELLKVDGSPKDKHVCWLKSRGLGGSWLILRIMTYLGLNELAGTQMAIVTGNRVELSVSLCNTIKS
jgi:hypothetical protein